MTKMTVLLQPGLQAHDFVLHVAADQRVERGEGFVEDQHFGIDGERPGKSDALLHATAELIRIRGLDACEPDDLENFACALMADLLRNPLHLEPVCDVVDHRPVREEPEVLETIATFVRRSWRSVRASAPRTS